jgi:hypothetical protein
VVPPAPGYIQLGISVEPLAELSAKEGSRLGEWALQQLAALQTAWIVEHPVVGGGGCSQDTDVRKEKLVGDEWGEQMSSQEACPSVLTMCFPAPSLIQVTRCSLRGG